MQDGEEIARANTVQGAQALGVSDMQPRNTSATVTEAGLQYPQKHTVDNHRIAVEITFDDLG